MDFILKPVRIIRHYRAVKKDLKRIRLSSPVGASPRFQLRQAR